MSARTASTRPRRPVTGLPAACALLLCGLACGSLPLPLFAGGIAEPAVLPAVSSSAMLPASMRLRQARHLGSIAPAGVRSSSGAAGDQFAAASTPAGAGAGAASAGTAPAQTPGSKLTVLHHSGDGAATGAGA